MIPASNILESDEFSFKKDVLDISGLVFVDFWAPWCGPCKLSMPIIEQLQQDFPTVRFVKVNTDQSPALATMYHISGIPSFLLFKDGNVVDQFVGAAPKKKFVEIIEKYL